MSENYINFFYLFSAVGPQFSRSNNVYKIYKYTYNIITFLLETIMNAKNKNEIYENEIIINFYAQQYTRCSYV